MLIIPDIGEKLLFVKIDTTNLLSIILVRYDFT